MNKYELLESDTAGSGISYGSIQLLVRWEQDRARPGF